MWTGLHDDPEGGETVATVEGVVLGAITEDEFTACIAAWLA